MMSTSGLMVTSNVGPFANEYHVAQAMVLGMAALPLSLTLSRVTNGLTRPFFGWVSDHIGREMTMFIAFSLGGRRDPGAVRFHRSAGAVRRADRAWCSSAGARSSRCSLRPSPIRSAQSYAATNYGFLYIAQGVGSILGGPAAAYLKQMTGDWKAVFIIVAASTSSTALLAITALRTMRARHIQAG